MGGSVGTTIERVPAPTVVGGVGVGGALQENPGPAARPGRPDHERDLAADLAMDSLPTKDQAVVPRGPIQGHGDSERGRPTAAVAGGIGRDRVAGSQQAVPGPHDLPSRSQTCDLRRVPGQVGRNVKADPISCRDAQSIRIPLDKEPGSARLRQNGRHGSLPRSRSAVLICYLGRSFVFCLTSIYRMDRINRIVWFVILSIPFILCIHVSVNIAATGCSGPLQSIESRHAEAGPFEPTDSGNPYVTINRSSLRAIVPLGPSRPRATTFGPTAKPLCIRLAQFVTAICNIAVEIGNLLAPETVARSRDGTSMPTLRHRF